MSLQFKEEKLYLKKQAALSVNGCQPWIKVGVQRLV